MKRVFFILLFIVLISGCSKSSETIISAKLSLVVGKVTLLRNDLPQEAKLNMKLQPNDIIRTGKDSEARIVFDDIGITVIKPNTSMEIKTLFKKIEGNQISMNIVKGRLLSSIKKISRDKQNGKFEIYTPTAVVGVRGTTFMVYVTPEEHTKVAVVAGSVDVKSIKEPENKVVVEELKEAIVPRQDFTKTKVVQMSGESYKIINTITKTDEIESEKFQEIKEEISRSQQLWKETKETETTKSIKKNPTSKKPEKTTW